MTVLTDPVEAACVALLQAWRLEPGLDKVQIEHGYPGEELKDECIWLGRINGNLTVPVFVGPDHRANPVRYDDNFIVPVHLMAGTPNQTGDQAAARVSVLYAGVLKVSRTTPRPAGIRGIVKVLMQTHRREVIATKQGYVGFIDVDLAGHIRIQGDAP